MSKTSSGWKDRDDTQVNVRRFHDFEVSWAGPGRRAGEFCFGSEDGRILTTDEQLTPVPRPEGSVVPSGEAINGVAFLNDSIAVSTRCEVALVSQQPVDGKVFRSVFPAGAHGVIVTPSGHCVAPLGRRGIMVITPSAGQDQPVALTKVSHKTVDFYKVTNVRCDRGEVLACAARKDGVAAMPFQSEGMGFVTSLSYPGLDVVDVCSLGQSLPSPAIAAISGDCTLILSRDALHDPRPTTIKFHEIRGTAYRVLNYDGNLLLLTSRAIYVLAGLSRRFLNKEPIHEKSTRVKAVVLEAVDANIADNRSLLVVMPDGVALFDLERLVGGVPSAESADGLQEASPIGMSPQWQPHTNHLESERRVMASAG
jgi:hypothetical protein